MQLVKVQDILLAVADNLQQLVTGKASVSTGAPTNKLVDSSKAGTGRDRWWQGSDIFFLDAPASQSSPNPFAVTDFVAADGSFLLSQPYGDTGVPQGVAYGIVRPHGQGVPYDSYLRAIRYALDKLDIASDARDTSLVTAVNTFEYTLPSTLDTVYDVHLDSPTLGHYVLMPSWWSLAPGRKLVILNRRLDVSQLFTLDIRGRKWLSMPSDIGTSTIRVPFDELVDMVTERLQRNSSKQVELAKGANQQQERLRFSSIYTYPNEQEIIP